MGFPHFPVLLLSVFVFKTISDIYLSLYIFLIFASSVYKNTKQLLRLSYLSPLPSPQNSQTTTKNLQPGFFSSYSSFSAFEDCLKIDSDLFGVLKLTLLLWSHWRLFCPDHSTNSFLMPLEYLAPYNWSTHNFMYVFDLLNISWVFEPPNNPVRYCQWSSWNVNQIISLLNIFHWLLLHLR